jgi:hypothetical protein
MAEILMVQFHTSKEESAPVAAVRSSPRSGSQAKYGILDPVRRPGFKRSREGNGLHMHVQWNILHRVFGSVWHKEFS